MEPAWKKVPGHCLVTYGIDEPKWIRVPLGDNDTESDGSKAEWCYKNVRATDFCLHDVGFVYSDYVIDFRHASDATMFLLRWGTNSG